MKTNAPFYKSIPFWLVVAFVVGFGVNEILSTMHLNPLRSQAFLSSGYSGYEDCSSWSGSSYDCGNVWGSRFQSFGSYNSYGIGGGGGGAPTSPNVGGSSIGGGAPPMSSPAPAPAPAPTRHLPCYYAGTCNGDNTGQ